MNDTIRSTVSVPWEPRKASRRSAQEPGGWWPPEYTWGGAAGETIGLGPREGGLGSERGPHRFRCDWGRVLAWAAPGLRTITWQVSPRREPVPDPARASVVEVRNAPGGDGGTEVTLEHSGFDRHGLDVAEYLAALASPQGWPYIHSRFAAVEHAP